MNLKRNWVTAAVQGKIKIISSEVKKAFRLFDTEKVLEIKYWMFLSNKQKSE